MANIWDAELQRSAAATRAKKFVCKHQLQKPLTLSQVVGDQKQKPLTSLQVIGNQKTRVCCNLIMVVDGQQNSPFVC
jgi:hypothetical protein